MKRNKLFIGGLVLLFLFVGIVSTVVAFGDFEQYLLDMETEIATALEAGDAARVAEIQASYINSLNLYREFFGENLSVWNTLTEPIASNQYYIGIWLDTVNEARSAMPAIGANTAVSYNCDANCQNVSNIIERTSPPYMASWVVSSGVDGDTATYFNTTGTASVTFWCAGGVAPNSCTIERVTVYWADTQTVDLFMDELALVTYAADL